MVSWSPGETNGLDSLVIGLGERNKLAYQTVSGNGEAVLFIPSHRLGQRISKFADLQCAMYFFFPGVLHVGCCDEGPTCST